MSTWKPKNKRLYDLAFEMKAIYLTHPTRETINAIARKYEMSEGSVYRYLRVAGVTPPPRQRDEKGRLI